MARTTRIKSSARRRGAVKRATFPAHMKRGSNIMHSTPKHDVELIELGSATQLTLGVPWVPAVEDVMGEDHRD